MASTVTAATMTVSISESINLNGKNQGATNTLSIGSINEVRNRIVTIPTSEVTVCSFGAAVSSGTYVAAGIRYIRLTNKDDSNYVTLNIEGANGTDFSVRLDPGASYLIVSSTSTGVVDYGDITAATLEDLTGIKATANSADVDLEAFIASA